MFDLAKKAELVMLLKKLGESGSCCEELKEKAKKAMESVDENTLKNLKEALKDSVTPIDKFIEFASSDKGKEIFGAKRDEMVAEAKKRMAAGEKVCICDACQTGKKILDLLG